MKITLGLYSRLYRIKIESIRTYFPHAFDLFAVWLTPLFRAHSPMSLSRAKARLVVWRKGFVPDLGINYFICCLPSLDIPILHIRQY